MRDILKNILFFMFLIAISVSVPVLAWWETTGGGPRVNSTDMRVETRDYYNSLVEIGYAQDKVNEHSAYFQTDHETNLAWWITTCKLNARIYNLNVKARGRIHNLPTSLDPKGCHA